MYGSSDWDDALHEAYVAAVLRGDIKPPEPAPAPTLEDYGQSVTFTLEEIMCL